MFNSLINNTHQKSYVYFVQKYIPAYNIIQKLHLCIYHNFFTKVCVYLSIIKPTLFITTNIIFIYIFLIIKNTTFQVTYFILLRHHNFQSSIYLLLFS